MKSVVFSVRMPKDMAAALQKAADKAGVKRNAWIVGVLDQALGAHAPISPEEKQKRKLVRAIEKPCRHATLKTFPGGKLKCVECGQEIL